MIYTERQHERKEKIEESLTCSSRKARNRSRRLDHYKLTEVDIRQLEILRNAGIFCFAEDTVTDEVLTTVIV